MKARPSVDKRRRERDRQQKKREKAERRDQRRVERNQRSEAEDNDPDIAGIVPGPQPLPEQFQGDEESPDVE